MREAVDRTFRLRQQGKDWFDAQATLRATPISQGDLVLVQDVFRDMDMSRNQKLKPRWKGPYRVRTVSEKATYTLEELDGTLLRATYAGNRLSKFLQRYSTDPTTVLEEDVEEVTEQEASPNGTLETGTSVLASVQRRSRRLQQQYSQDLPGQKVEVRIPAPTSFNPSDYEWFDKIEEDSVG